LSVRRCEAHEVAQDDGAEGVEFDQSLAELGGEFAARESELARSGSQTGLQEMHGPT
jgi:hypothetical protein